MTHLAPDCTCEATCCCAPPSDMSPPTTPTSGADAAVLLRDLVRTAPMKIDGGRMTWLGASCRFIAAFTAARNWTLRNPAEGA